MYKLTYRLGHPLFIGAFILFAAAIVALFGDFGDASWQPARLSGSAYWKNIPTLWLGPGLLGCVLLPAIFYQVRLSDRITASLTFLLTIFLLGTIGNLVGAPVMPGPQTFSSVLQVNWIELLTIAGGALVTTMALLGREPLENPIDDVPISRPVEEPAKGKSTSGNGKQPTAPNAPPEVIKSAEKVASTAPSDKAAPDKTAAADETAPSGKGKRSEKEPSRTDLKGLLDKLDPDAEAAPAPTGKSALTNPPAKATPPSGLVSGKKAEPAKGAAKGGSTKSSPAPNATPPSVRDKPAPEVKPTAAPEPAKSAPVPAAAPATAAPSETKKSPTSTATRLQAQKRKSTSTFTKLQALSATPTTPNRPAKGDPEESDSLKSILDRLDTQPEEEEPVDFLPQSESLLPPAPVPEPELPDLSALSKPREPAVMQFEPPKSESAKSPVEKTSGKTDYQSDRAFENRTPASDQPTPSLSAMLDSMDKEQAPAPAPPAEPESAKANQDTSGYTKDDLISIKTPKIASSGLDILAKEAGKSKKDLSFIKKSDSLQSDEGDLPAESLHTVAPEEQLVSDTLTMSPDSTNEQPQAEAISFAPEASALETAAISEPRPLPEPVGETPAPEPVGETPAPAPPAETPAAEPIAEAPAPPAETPATPTAEAAPIEPVAETPASAESSPEPTGEAPAAETPAQPEAVKAEEPPAVSSVFGAKVDKDINDLFSSLAPAEGQKEVTKPEGEAAAPTEAVSAAEEKKQEEPPVAAEPEKADNVFGAHIDKDIDDLFSSIVPVEAQKEVKDSGYNKPYGDTKADAPAQSVSVEASRPEPTKVETALDLMQSIEDEVERATAAASAAEPVKAETPVTAEVPAKTEAPKEESAAGADFVFGGGVDQDIDDIFSAIVPEQARKEVKDSTYNKAYGEGTEAAPSATPEPAAKPEPSSGSAESAKEPETVAPVAAAAAVEPTVEAPAAAPVALEPAAEPAKLDNVFGQSIDKDIDDLFFDIVPEAARKEVKDSGYKKAYGEKEAEPAGTTAAEAAPVLSLAPEPASPEPVTADATVSEEGSKEPEAPAVVEAEAPPVAPVVEATPTAPKTEAPAKQEPAAPIKETVTISANTIKPSAPGRFNQTLAHLPSLQGTVEGLLNNLAALENKILDAAQTGTTEDEIELSVEPGATATDVLESMLEQDAAAPETAAPEPEPVAAEAEPEPVEAAPVVEAVIESVVETAPEPVVEPVVEPAPAAPTAAAEPPAKVEAPPAREQPMEAPKPAPAEPAPAKAPPPAAPARPPEAKPADTRGKEIEAPMAPTRTAEVSQALIDVEKANQAAERARQVAAVDKQLKEFGRLSSKSAKAPLSNAPAGTMKTIGKLLIEVGAVENIIKTGEATGKLGSGLATARIITAAKGEGIQALLGKIDEQKGVVGSVIVGHDGLVIASTLPAEMDKDSMGVLSLACLSTSNLATKQLEIGQLQQMVLITEQYMTILTEVQVGILAVYMDGIPIDRVDDLCTTIEQTVHG